MLPEMVAAPCAGVVTEAMLSGEGPASGSLSLASTLMGAAIPDGVHAVSLTATGGLLAVGGTGVTETPEL